MATKLTYPYISTNPEIADGAPLIRGTRITVRMVAGYYQMGMTPDEILLSLPHLPLSQIHSALAYYFDHQREVDEDLRAATDEEYWKKQVKRHPKSTSTDF